MKIKLNNVKLYDFEIAMLKAVPGNAPINKVPHIEESWDDKNSCPKYTKLYLYYSMDQVDDLGNTKQKHVATYNRDNRSGWVF